MTRFRRAAVATAGVAVVALAVPACASDGEGVVRVYTGRHYDLEPAFEAFAEETGISVEFLPGDDASLRERIASEGDDTEADIYMTVDAGNLAIAAEEGLFEPLDSEVLEGAVPDSLRDPDGQWFGLSRRIRSIAYNPEAVSEDEVPTTYEQLADPEWDGRLCLRDSTNVYTQSLVASLIANHGEEEALRIVEGWAGNAEILDNDVLILDYLAEGVCDVGIVNHYYLARELEENPDFPVEMVWANQDDRGVHVNISGAGVVKGADDPDLAQQLLEWLATDGQSLFVDGNHEYPVNPDVDPDDLLQEEFGTDFEPDPLSAAEFGALNPDAIRVMDEAGYR